MRIDGRGAVPIENQYVDQAVDRLVALAQEQQQAQRDLLKCLLNQVEADASLTIEGKRKIQCSIVNEALQVELDFHRNAQNFQRGWISHLLKLPGKSEDRGTMPKAVPPIDPAPLTEHFARNSPPVVPLPLLLPKPPPADEVIAPVRLDADGAKTPVKVTIRRPSDETPRRKRSRLQGSNSPDSVPVITIAESGSECDGDERSHVSPILGLTPAVSRICESRKYATAFHPQPLAPSFAPPPAMHFPSFNLPSIPMAPFHPHLPQMPQLMYPFAQPPTFAQPQTFAQPPAFAPQTSSPFGAPFPVHPARAFSVAPIRRFPQPAASRVPMRPMAAVERLLRETPIGGGSGDQIMETPRKQVRQGKETSQERQSLSGGKEAAVTPEE